MSVLLTWAGGANASLFGNPDPAISVASAKREAQKGNTAAAIIELRNAIRGDPGNTEARFELARLYMSDDNPAGALSELENARARGHNANEILPLLARCYLALGRFKDVLDKASAKGLNDSARANVLASRARAAIGLNDLRSAHESVDEALALNATDSYVLLASAMLLSAEGQFSEAEAQIEKARDDGDQVELLVLRGELRQRQNDLDGAVKYYDHAVTSFPRNAVARIQRATVNIARNRIAEAEDDVTWVLARYPNQPLGLFLRSYLLAREKQYQEATQILLGLPQLLATYSPAMYLLTQIALQDGQNDLALGYAERYLRLAPNDVNGLRALALAHQRTGKPERAVEILTQLTARLPNDNALRLQHADALLQSGRSEEAIALFQEGLVAAPDSAQARLSLAVGQLRVGRTDAGLAQIEKVVQSVPNSIEANTLLVLTHLQRRQFDDALRSARAAAKADSENPRIQNLLGTVYLATKSYPEARTAFQLALKQDAKFLPAILNLARTEQRGGNPAAARREYQRAISVDPANLLAHEGLASLALADGDLEGGIAYLKEAAARNAGVAEPRLRFIEFLLTRQRYPEALAEAQALANAMPQLPQALDTLGRAQIIGGDVEGGIASYRRLVAQNPDNAEAQRRLGHALMAGGPGSKAPDVKRVGEARAAFDRALALAPDDLGLVHDRVLFERHTNGAAAAQTLAEQFVAARPDSVTRLIVLGDLHASADRKSAATAVYSRAWEKSKVSATTLRLYTAVMREGKDEAAHKILKEWVGQHPEDFAARATLAGHYTMTGKTAEAIIETEALDAAFPENPMLLNNLAWLYAKDSPTKAITVAERAVALAPQSPDVLDTLGWLYVTTSSAARGESLLRRAHEMAPTRRDIGFRYAVALERSARPAEAQAVLKGVLADDTEFAERAEALALFNKLNASK